MGRAEQIQATLEARERGAEWCREQRSHTVLMGEYECYVCGKELSARELQIAATACAPSELDIRFVAPGELFDTPDGAMRAADGVCRCGRRGVEHSKMYPWTRYPRRYPRAPAIALLQEDVRAGEDCPGFVALAQDDAVRRGTPQWSRMPRAKRLYTEREDGVRVYGERRCGSCGHAASAHRPSCASCSCRLLTVR